MLIEHVLAKPPVEAFDASILIGFAGLDRLSNQIIVRALLFACLTQALWAIVRANDFGQTMVALDLRQDARPTHCVDRGIDRDVCTLTVAVINHVKGAKASTTVQGIAHEIDRSGVIGTLRHS